MKLKIAVPSKGRISNPSIDILENMGCDIRILQMEGVKDPDEYIIKYGVVRFQNLMQNAISLFEFKVKTLNLI